MAKKMKIDYDAENDILFVYSGDAAKDSLQIDEFVIDFSSENKIVAIEIFDASKILSKLSEMDVTKDALSGMGRAAMSIYQGKELVYITLLLHLCINKEEVDLKIPVAAPAAVAEIA